MAQRMTRIREVNKVKRYKFNSNLMANRISKGIVNLVETSHNLKIKKYIS